MLSCVSVIAEIALFPPTSSFLKWNNIRFEEFVLDNKYTTPCYKLINFHVLTSEFKFSETEEETLKHHLVNFNALNTFCFRNPYMRLITAAL